MVGFRRFFLVIFLSFASIFVFIFLIRLANNKSGFVGLNDLFSYFESVDFYKPLNRFSKSFEDLKRSFDSFASSINVNNLFPSSTGSGGRGYDPKWYEQVASIVSNTFSYLGNNVVNFFKMLYSIIFMPIKLVFDIVLLFVDYFSIFTKFVDYLINFDGYSYTSPIL